MIIKRNLFAVTALIASSFLFAGVAAAQDQTKPATTGDSTVKTERGDRKFGRDGRKGEFGRHRGHRGMDRRGMGMFRGIELTDSQKTQFKALRDANKPTAEGREEMRTLHLAKRAGTLTADQQARLDTLKADGKAKRLAMKQQIDEILTPEQKAQIETRKQEMKQRREEFRQRREQRKADRSTSTETKDK